MRTRLPTIGYIALGLLLVLFFVPMTWSLVSRSVDSGDSDLAVFFGGGALVIAAMLFLKHWRPRVSFQTLDGRTSVKFHFDRRQQDERPQDFHPWKPWKMPYTTTSRVLWLRAGLTPLVLAAFTFWLNHRLELGAPLASASVLLIGIPFEYRRQRCQYEPVQTEDDASGHLRYKGPSKMSWRETSLMMILSAIAIVVIVGFELWLSD